MRTRLHDGPLQAMIAIVDHFAAPLVTVTAVAADEALRWLPASPSPSPPSGRLCTGALHVVRDIVYPIAREEFGTPRDANAFTTRLDYVAQGGLVTDIVDKLLPTCAARRPLTSHPAAEMCLPARTGAHGRSRGGSDPGSNRLCRRPHPRPVACMQASILVELCRCRAQPRPRRTARYIQTAGDSTPVPAGSAARSASTSGGGSSKNGEGTNHRSASAPSGRPEATTMADFRLRCQRRRTSRSTTRAPDRQCAV